MTEMTAKPRVLVTGAQGLIGFNLFNYFRNKTETAAFSKKATPDKLQAGKEWYEGLLEDYGRISEVFDDFKPEVVIHAQAMCNLDLCEVKPDKTHLVNVTATEKLLSALPDKTHLVYISSEHVFSGKKGPYKESDPTDPITVYGKTRVEAESLIQKARPDALIIRSGLMVGRSMQNNIGPHDWLRGRLEAGLPASYFADELRSPITASVYCKAAEFLITAKESGIWNIAGKTTLSRYGLACLLRDAWGYEKPITKKYTNEDKLVPRMTNCALNTDKLSYRGFDTGEFIYEPDQSATTA